MRILYHHRTASRDGQEVHIRELVAAFRRLGHEVLVASPAGVGTGASESRNDSMGGSRGAVGRLAQLVPDRLRPLAARVYDAVATRRVLAAARAFRPDFIYERHALFNRVGARVARALDVPLLLEVNSPLAREEAALGRIGDAARAVAAESAALAGADAVLAVTAALKQILVEDGVPEARIHVVANGVDEAVFLGPRDAAAKTRLGVADRLVLGFVGFARPWHGLDRVVRALPALPSAVLLVGGEGPALPEVRALAAELGVLDRVRLAGVIERAAIPGFVDAFDVALQPEVTSYASPLKLFEYLARGVCVLAPRRPNIEEVVEDGVNAVLFEPEREGDFDARLRELAADPARRARIGAAGRARLIAGGYTWTANARRVAALAEERVRCRTA